MHFIKRPDALKKKRGAALFLEVVSCANKWCKLGGMEGGVYCMDLGSFSLIMKGLMMYSTSNGPI